jgi:hypothetical protein
MLAQLPKLAPCARKNHIKIFVAAGRQMEYVPKTNVRALSARRFVTVRLIVELVEADIKRMGANSHDDPLHSSITHGLAPC